MRKHKQCYTIGVLAMLAVVVGCGKKEWGHLTGTVSLNGQPIGPGVISFEPIDGQRAGAVARIEDDGKYKVISARSKEGARTGEYRVTIHSSLKDFGFEDKGSRPAPIPSKYADPKTSGLTATIEPGEKTLDFELKQ
jgi:hypothetical protein